MSISSPSSRQFRHVPTQIFHPLYSVRSTGQLVFRNQLARDVACLLDVDATVVTWSCKSMSFAVDGEVYRPDFVVERDDGILVIDVRDGGERPVWLAEVVLSQGYLFESFDRADVPTIRLRNAKDLLRYARYDVSLDDRVRLLAALEENGTLTVAECLPAFKTVPPIAGLASLILSRFIAVDIDDALIGPETTVRRHRG